MRRFGKIWIRVFAIVCFFWAAVDESVAQEIPGLDDPRFKQAVQQWLSGDDASYAVLGELARDGNIAATVLIARLLANYVDKHGDGFAYFSKVVSMTGFSDIHSPTEFVESQIRETRSITPLAALMLESAKVVRNKGYQGNWDRLDLARQLYDQGEERVAQNLLKEEDYAAFSVGRKLNPRQKGYVYWQALNGDLPPDREREELDEFFWSWSIRKLTSIFGMSYFFYTNMSDLRVKLLPKHAMTYGTAALLGVFLGGEKMFMTTKEHVGSNPDRLAEYELLLREIEGYRAALPDIHFMIETDNAFQPIRSVCRTMCPSSVNRCTRAVLASADLIETIYKFSTPSESIIPQDIFINSKRAVEYLMGGKTIGNSPPLRLMKSDSVIHETQLRTASIEEINSCAANTIQSYHFSDR